MVFIGDKPWKNVQGVSWGTKLDDDETIEDLDDGDPDKARLMDAMSPHHRDGEVMICASKSGVFRVGRADVGHNDDAIFTQGPKRNGGVRAATIGSRLDSMLLRPDEK